MFLYIGMLRCAYLDMFDKFLRSKISAACFAPFKGMYSYGFIADGYDSVAIFVGHLDSACGAEVYACSTANTKPLFGRHVTDPFPFLHFKRPCAHDFVAYANA